MNDFDAHKRSLRMATPQLRKPCNRRRDWRMGGDRASRASVFIKTDCYSVLRFWQLLPADGAYALPTRPGATEEFRVIAGRLEMPASTLARTCRTQPGTTRPAPLSRRRPAKTQPRRRG